MPRTLDSIYDQWLVLRAQGGERRAYRLLVERWNAKLLRQAWALTGRRDAAEDVLQEAWLAVVRRLHTLDDPARFGPWAYGILRHKAADRVRRSQRDRRAMRRLADEAPEAPSRAGDAPADEDLVAVLGSLSPDHRAVLVMHYLESMSVADIAALAGVPEGTVKSRLHHAREHARQHLERNKS